MEELQKKVTLSREQSGYYFHVLGDDRIYFDLVAVELHHPELEEYLAVNRFELERELHQLEELNERESDDNGTINTESESAANH